MPEHPVLRKSFGQLHHHPKTHQKYYNSQVRNPIHRLTPTKLIKEQSKTSFLPVIIFSSMISEAMMKKGEQLGADAQITKPEIGSLVGEIDRLILQPAV